MSCAENVLPSLDSKIPGRHEFQFKLLADRPVTSAIFGKSSGGLALEFPLADIADIGADHEAEQMLGIDALGANGSRKQRREAHDAGPEHFCADRHSHPKDRWRE